MQHILYIYIFIVKVSYRIVVLNLFLNLPQLFSHFMNLVLQYLYPFIREEFQSNHQQGDQNNDDPRHVSIDRNLPSTTDCQGFKP